ncbi:MAG: hypothetical protein PHT84_01095 [Candidatus Pacebacteria bacterium]|nr:hypothetical protein [Candidatus Paceibacterota bacterium]
MKNKMENKNISQIALEKIKEKGIRPISKKFFYLRKLLFWFLVVLSIVIGSISFAITISFLVNNDWSLYRRFGFSFILQTLPYFWFICLGFFVFLGEFYYKKTYLGYRYRAMLIVGFYLLITVILGSLIYYLRIEDKIEQSIHRNVPIYRNFIFDREIMWMQPEQGFLSGEIIFAEDDKLEIKDKNNIVWNIKINKDDVFISPKIVLENGQEIKIIGRKEGGYVFIAEEIRPWFNNVGRMNSLNGNRDFRLDYKMR